MGRLLAATVIYAATSLSIAPVMLAAEIQIQIDASQAAGATIPRTIFGTFLEPIGHSINGGLSAQLLANPSFEADLWSVKEAAKLTAAEPALVKASSLGLPLPWRPLAPEQGNRYEPHRGDAANSFQSIALLGVSGSRTGMAQTIHLPVQRTLRYQGSIFLKHLSGDAMVRLALLDEGGKPLAEASVQADNTAWAEYPYTLELHPNQVQPLQPAQFAVEVENGARVQVDQASLMPSDAIEGLDPDVVRMARELRTPLLRFGGNFTSGYHWRDGIGPANKRLSMLNVAWGIPEYNTFGTDELLRFCDLIGAEPQIALNLGSGTADEAAAWVAYVNQHWKTHAGLLWELGNELWGNWNLGYPTLNEIADRTAAFSKAVRAVDPEARLIATGQDPDRFEEWNSKQLKTPADTFRFLATHFVVTTSDATAVPSTPAGLAEATFALPVELGRRIEKMQKQIDRARKGSDPPHIAFTEWLFHGGALHDGAKESPTFLNMGGAVAAAGMLDMLLVHSNNVPISDMTGLLEFAGIWKDREQVYGTPSYYAFRMYSTAELDHLVAVDNDTDTYRISEGIRRLPDIVHVPLLETVAALDRESKRLTIFCINRSLTDDFKASFRLRGFDGVESVAHAQVLRAVSIYDGNNGASPDRVRPMEQPATVAAGTLHFVFPRASVVRLDLTRN